jgi:hypothetical protein
MTAVGRDACARIRRHLGRPERMRARTEGCALRGRARRREAAAEVIERHIG